jgi:hypothetical protein
MATIVLIVIGVISLLVKQNKLTREVFCWLAVGREHSMFFPAKKAQNECWEVVSSLEGVHRLVFKKHKNIKTYLSRQQFCGKY